MSETSKIIRREWLENDLRRDRGLKEPADVKAFKNISYGPAGEWNLLDVYRPESVKEKLPVLLSIHGGGYVYGTKEIYKFYLMNMARKGFACINFNYRLAPENRFPAALEDTDLVVKWVFDNAEKYGFDLNNIFITGDSAGAHYAALYSLLCTNAEYAELVGIVPCNNFVPKAVLLNCGTFGAESERKNELLEDLMGDRIKEAETLLNVDRYVDSRFPECFLMTGYHDFLKEQNILMDKIFTEKNVSHLFKIYGDEKTKKSGHVFHVNQKLPLAEICNSEEAEFLKKFFR